MKNIPSNNNKKYKVQYNIPYQNEYIIENNPKNYVYNDINYYVNGQTIQNPLKMNTYTPEEQTYTLENINYTDDKRKTFTPMTRQKNKNILPKENYIIANNNNTPENIIMNNNAYKYVKANNNDHNLYNIINDKNNNNYYEYKKEQPHEIIYEKITNTNNNNINDNKIVIKNKETEKNEKSNTGEKHQNNKVEEYENFFSSKPDNNGEMGNKNQNINKIDIQATIISDGFLYQNEDFESNKSPASELTMSSLADKKYVDYPKVKGSSSSFYNLSAFALNSYNGKVKKFNEDRARIIVNAQINKPTRVKHNISYFGIFDGHGGNKCSTFLYEHFHEYLFNSNFFPEDPIKAIRETFKKAEEDFFKMAYDPNNKKLIDKSGSCAVVSLIIDNILYSINLGDSRSLYSYGTGTYIYQITRDHKPNDEIEKKRIESVGGEIYYANTITRNGIEIELKEENFGKGFKFPYRINPGKIAVS